MSLEATRRFVDPTQIAALNVPLSLAGRLQILCTYL